MKCDGLIFGGRQLLTVRRCGNGDGGKSSDLRVPRPINKSLADLRGFEPAASRQDEVATRTKEFE
jgi:hypothetical protein